MVFRFHHALGAGDADCSEIVAQPRQRPLLQEAGQGFRHLSRSQHADTHGGNGQVGSELIQDSAHQFPWQGLHRLHPGV